MKEQMNNEANKAHCLLHDRVIIIALQNKSEASSFLGPPIRVYLKCET